MNELLRHSQRALVHVEVLPPNAAPLAAAQATESDEVEQGVQPMLGRDVEECAELDRSPDHHGGRSQFEGLPDPYGTDLLAALLRLHGRQALGELGVERLHLLLGPHQSLGPLGLVQLDGLLPPESHL
ncbi:hypothetical protein [Nonomuraea jabiensis]|uniref:hypothetical protein n=1 Tax=Nonomuraea jabiensis TaxID=882448 RepID=UPI001FE7B48B|nr:hypothetical protein [Nonomuraea jabiensis]